VSYDTVASANFRERRCVDVIDELNIWKDSKMNTKSLFGLIGLAAIGLAACGSASQPGAGYGAAPQTPTTIAAPAAPTASSSVTLAHTALGTILADNQGRTLYALTKDTNGIPTCTDACARAWPPATITGAASPASDVAAPTTVVDAPGGGKMLKVGKWPLYRFAGDAAPGDINGQGSGGVFFVVGADGKLIKA
jgi:predicted lipoprotein with Yx(FWY)xxD motif